ncbi:DNA-binding NarL/FixJ family response regulator [Crossiella equi]|uniref:DNA-binding NarL/FixJ family response regulator n=1 Tax=Crossiella equi TaxID=130796 RepID=A0ABS5AD03_9PSEU|nr:response regulator transcription factor [Crossiella equi]MBP2474468.1 DNA-binding NarL/FixJ family response regulator [Crossiella equi]
MIRVFVVDDQAMVRESFAALLAAQDGMSVVGTAGDGREALTAIRALDPPPDVVLMDIRMPVLDGLETTRLLLADESTVDRTRVLVLTTFDLDDYVFEALRAGASGFLLKDAPAAELVNAIRVVARGEALLAPAVTRTLIAEFVRSRPAPRARPDRLAALTNRETEVLTLVARGLSNPEIAVELVLSEQTVKTHINRILAKLAVRDRAQAIVLAYETGLVRTGQA